MEKYEGALGKGKGRKLYVYKVMMTKVRNDQKCKKYLGGIMHIILIKYNYYCIHHLHDEADRGGLTTCICWAFAIFSTGIDKVF